MATGDFFRREAVDSQSVTFGRVIAHAPPGLTVIAAFMALTLVIAIGFATSFKVPRTVQIEGWLHPDAGYVHVTTRLEGVLTSLPVAEGALVSADQVVARVSLADGEHLRNVVDQQIVERFAERVALVQGAFGLAAQEAEERRAALRAEIAEAEAEVRALEAEIEIGSEIVALSLQQLAQAQELAERGSGSVLQVQTRMRALLEARAEHARLVGRRDRLMERKQALEDRGRAEEAASLRTQAMLRDQEIELSIAALEAEARVGQDLVAPRPGRVISVRGVEGAAVAAGERIVTVLPDYRHLLVHALLPVHALGAIEPGQRTRLRLDAAGGSGGSIELDGVVTSISPAAMTGLEFDAPIAPQGRFHRVIVELDPLADSVAHAIEPGMTLRASITYRRDPVWRLMLPDQA